MKRDSTAPAAAGVRPKRARLRREAAAADTEPEPTAPPQRPTPPPESPLFGDGDDDGLFERATSPYDGRGSSPLAAAGSARSSESSSDEPLGRRARRRKRAGAAARASDDGDPELRGFASPPSSDEGEARARRRGPAARPRARKGRSRLSVIPAEIAEEMQAREQAWRLEEPAAEEPLDASPSLELDEPDQVREETLRGGTAHWMNMLADLAGVSAEELRGKYKKRRQRRARGTTETRTNAEPGDAPPDVASADAGGEADSAPPATTAAPPAATSAFARPPQADDDGLFSPRKDGSCVSSDFSSDNTGASGSESGEDVLDAITKELLQAALGPEAAERQAPAAGAGGGLSTPERASRAREREANLTLTMLQFLSECQPRWTAENAREGGGGEGSGGGGGGNVPFVEFPARFKATSSGVAGPLRAAAHAVKSHTMLSAAAKPWCAQHGLAEGGAAAPAPGACRLEDAIRSHEREWLQQDEILRLDQSAAWERLADFFPGPTADFAKITEVTQADVEEEKAFLKSIGCEMFVGRAARAKRAAAAQPGPAAEQPAAAAPAVPPPLISAAPPSQTAAEQPGAAAVASSETPPSPPAPAFAPPVPMEKPQGSLSRSASPAIEGAAAEPQSSSGAEAPSAESHSLEKMSTGPVVESSPGAPPPTALAPPAAPAAPLAAPLPTAYSAAPTAPSTTSSLRRFLVPQAPFQPRDPFNRLASDLAKLPPPVEPHACNAEQHTSSGSEQRTSLPPVERMPQPSSKTVDTDSEPSQTGVDNVDAIVTAADSEAGPDLDTKNRVKERSVGGPHAKQRARASRSRRSEALGETTVNSAHPPASPPATVFAAPQPPTPAAASSEEETELWERAGRDSPPAPPTAPLAPAPSPPLAAPSSDALESGTARAGPDDASPPPEEPPRRLTPEEIEALRQRIAERRSRRRRGRQLVRERNFVAEEASEGEESGPEGDAQPRARPPRKTRGASSGGSSDGSSDGSVDSETELQDEIAWLEGVSRDTADQGWCSELHEFHRQQLERAAEENFRKLFERGVDVRESREFVAGMTRGERLKLEEERRRMREEMSEEDAWLAVIEQYRQQLRARRNDRSDSGSESDTSSRDLDSESGGSGESSTEGGLGGGLGSALLARDAGARPSNVSRRCHRERRPGRIHAGRERVPGLASRRQESKLPLTGFSNENVHPAELMLEKSAQLLQQRNSKNTMQGGADDERETAAGNAAASAVASAAPASFAEWYMQMEQSTMKT